MSKVQIPVPVSPKTEELAEQLRTRDWVKNPVLSIPAPKGSSKERRWYYQLKDIFFIEERRVPVLNSKMSLLRWDISEDPCNDYVPPADWE
jgi:hypothetical protein